MDEVRRVRDESGSGGSHRNRGRAPGWQLVALGLPHGVSRYGIQRDRERIGLRVTLEDHEAIPDDRRAGGPPLERRNVVRAHVDATEIDLPSQGAVEIVGVDPLRSEPRDDDPSVGGRTRARIGRLDVPFVEWLAFAGHALPQSVSGALVDRVHHPALT